MAMAYGAAAVGAENCDDSRCSLKGRSKVLSWLYLRRIKTWMEPSIDIIFYFSSLFINTYNNVVN
jgi:hypothetical protein